MAVIWRHTFAPPQYIPEPFDSEALIRQHRDILLCGWVAPGATPARTAEKEVMTMRADTGAILVVLAVLAGCDRRQPDQSGWQGYVEAEYTYIAPLETGRIASLSVQRGDEVQEGAPLFALENNSQFAAREQAEAKLRSGSIRPGRFAKGQMNRKTLP